MITDPLFYAAAIPAVLLYGMGKGGLGGAPGAIAVPLMTLAIDPVSAAAILLPIICIMDLHVIKLFWGKYDKRILRIIVPASLVGVAAATFLLDALSVDQIKALVGVIAVGFCLQKWLGWNEANRQPANTASGVFWGVLAGFTSTHIHAGGPPISVYLLTQKLDKIKLVGTLGVFFAVLNYVKLVPYTYLGQFDASTLLTSLLLAPLAPIGVRVGYYLVHRLEPDVIFRAIYILLFVSGVRLLFEGTRNYF